MKSTQRWTMLGSLAKGDQRAAQHKDNGCLYLFDFSGSNPDKTDDGPLRFDCNRPIEVGMQNIEVPVLCERDGDDKKHVFVTSAGLMRLLQMLQYPPETLVAGPDGSAEPLTWPFNGFELKFSPEAVTFMAIGRAGTKIRDRERRVRTNVGPLDVERT